MTKPNAAEAPRSQCGLSNLFLLALHVGVLALSLWIHPCFTPADRALPYVVLLAAGL
jgi:hypothetical protein